MDIIWAHWSSWIRARQSWSCTKVVQSFVHRDMEGLPSNPKNPHVLRCQKVLFHSDMFDLVKKPRYL